jgi:C4-dicarboxylate-binding protein DctP
MEKRRWIILVASLVLLVAILLPSCAKEEKPAPAAPAPAAPAPAPAPKPVEVKTIKISYSCPKGKGYSAGEEWFGPEFEKRTNGRYKVEVYGASTLVPITAVLDSVRKGVCQIGLTSTAQFAKDFPLSQLTMTSTLGWPGADLAMYTASTEAWMEFAKIPEVAAELNNGFTFAWNDILNASNLVMKKKEVHYPADFSGTKIAAIGANAELVKANGGATVAVVTPEIYMNMEKGVIEGSFMSMTMVTDWKIQTLADYFYLFDFGCGNMLILYNNEFYNSLPPEDKKIFDQTRADSWAVTRDLMIKTYSDSVAQLKAEGEKLTQPTADETKAWQKTVSEILIPKWREDAKSVGVSDATLDKVYKSWLSIREKYWKKYNLPGTP